MAATSAEKESLSYEESFYQPPEELFRLGLKYSNGQGVAVDKVKARNFYQMSASQDHAQAQYNFGLMLLYGEGGGKNKTLALHYFQRAAKQGHAVSQYAVGIILLQSRDEKQNTELACKYFRLSAGQGYAKAQFTLGLLLLNGVVVSQDEKSAYSYIQLAANQGYASAQCRLGKLLELGQGCDQDVSKSKDWYRLALKEPLQQIAKSAIGPAGESIRETEEERLKKRLKPVKEEFLTISPLEIAYRVECDDELILLLSQHSKEALLLAIKYQRLHLVKQIYGRLPKHAQRAALLFSDKDGYTFLHMVAKEGCLDTAIYLINQGAHIKVTSSEGKNIVHVAAENNHKIFITKLPYPDLVTRRALLNARDINGNTPLHLASQEGREDAIEGLISLGVTIDPCNIEGKTPLRLTFENNHFSSAHLLVLHDAELRSLFKDIFLSEEKKPEDRNCGHTYLQMANRVNSEIIAFIPKLKEKIKYLKGDIDKDSLATKKYYCFKKLLKRLRKALLPSRDRPLAYHIKKWKEEDSGYKTKAGKPLTHYDIISQPERGKEKSLLQEFIDLTMSNSGYGKYHPSIEAKPALTVYREEIDDPNTDDDGMLLVTGLEGIDKDSSLVASSSSARP